LIKIGRVILISGKAQNGKDTMANILKEKLENRGNKVLIIHFADLLKFLCQKYFNWNGKKDNQGRILLQYIGTDVIRKNNPNYWVDFVIELLKMFENEWDYILIPDARFPNELERFVGFDTINLRINRPNFNSSLTEGQKNHPSETSLDNYNFDYVISCEEGLDKIEAEIDKFIEWMEMNNG